MTTAAVSAPAVTASRATRVLLLVATVLFPPAFLSSLPIAFGIAMTNFDTSASMLANPWLFVLGGVMLIDLIALGVTWTLHQLRRSGVGLLLSAFISASISALVLLDLASALAS